MQIRILENDANQRIDKFLRKYLNNATLSFIYKLIRTRLKINNKKVKQDYRLKIVDILDLKIDKSLIKKKKKKTTEITFKILYEDPYYLIVDKPAGLVSHSGTEHKENTLADQINFYLKTKSLSFMPALANRLDKNTSGIVIIGKTAEALRSINKELHERRVKKYYLAMVKGKLDKVGKIETYLERVKLHEQVKVKILENKIRGAQKAITYYKPFKHVNNYTLLLIELDTGRTHQIRAHLAHIGYPILGDDMYGDKELNKKLKLKRQFLHAYRVSFIHPITKQRLEIESKLAEDLKEFMHRLEEKIFLYKIQQEKIKELWDNKDDEVWDL